MPPILTIVAAVILGAVAALSTPPASTPPAVAPTIAALPSGEAARARGTVIAGDPDPLSPPPAPDRVRLFPPLARGLLSSRFGLRADPMTGRVREHRGLDIAAPAGAPIMASARGVVAYAGAADGYGLLVAIDHGTGVQTRYGHMSHMFVRTGEPVERGTVIGLVGSTGRSTGSHLHFEARVGGAAVDPSRPLTPPAPAPRADATVASDPQDATPRWRGWTLDGGHLPAAF